MKKSNTKTVTAIIALVLVLGLLLSLFAQVIAFTAYGADNDAKLASLREQLSKAKSATSEIQKTVSALSKDKKAMFDKKLAIEKQMDATQEEIDLCGQMIEELKVQIEESEANLVVAKEQEQAQYELFKSRIRAAYENDNASMLEMIFTASSFTEIFTRLEYAQDIAAYDKKIMDNLTKTREYIEELKLSLETDKAEQEELRINLQRKSIQLMSQSQELDRLISELDEQIKKEQLTLDEKKRIQAQIQSDYDEVLADIRRAEARRSGGSSTYTGGQMQWPLPGYYKVSSDYSMRNHPITGSYSQHTGIDLPAPKGTKIRAAADGEVITVGTNKAYGMRVVISHGGGITTLYAHMSAYNCKVGQKVSAGDVIGYVGSTGYSTGNHLHFSVLKNGNYVSPWGYVSK